MSFVIPEVLTGQITKPEQVPVLFWQSGKVFWNWTQTWTNLIEPISLVGRRWLLALEHCNDRVV